MSQVTSLATVTFEGDLRLTVLQALSVDRLLNLADVAEYVVVLNGKDDDALEADFRRHIAGRVSDEFLEKLRILRRADMPRGGDGTGWYGQQIIKLALADVVKGGTYLMLDGKNHFVRPTRVSEFFRDGKPITQFTDTSATWDKYVRASLVAMDALTDERVSRMMPTTTPYLMLTPEVRAATGRLETKYAQPLPSAIRQTGWGTEFFLYYAHLTSTFEDIPYVHGPSLTRTLYADWPQDPRKCLEIIGSTVTADVPMFGLHRKRLPQLNAEQTAAIVALWRRHLLKDWEDADWFLAELG